MAQFNPPITTSTSHIGSNRLRASIACLLVAYSRGSL
jgi:hypothetical protein